MIKNFIKSTSKKISSFLGNSPISLTSKILSFFSNNDKSIDNLIEDIEELLIDADLGASLAHTIATRCASAHNNKGAPSEEDIKNILLQELEGLIQETTPLIESAKSKPQVILFVGVNGSGKTTSLAKIAYQLKNKGHKVLIGAADTFRTAAVEQLETWAQRIGCDIVKGKLKADPSSVIYDSIQAGISRNADYILLDSAGRLESKSHLMKELNKIERTCTKLIPDAPHSTLMVIDASIGQNAIEQAKTFDSFINVNGLILSKYDGSSRGGSCISIYQSLKLPIYYVGTGEKLEDIEKFDSKSYIENLVS